MQVEVKIVLEIENASDPSNCPFALRHETDLLRKRVVRLVPDNGRNDARVTEVVLRDVRAKESRGIGNTENIDVCKAGCGSQPRKPEIELEIRADETQLVVLRICVVLIDHIFLPGAKCRVVFVTALRARLLVVIGEIDLEFVRRRDPQRQTGKCDFTFVHVLLRGRDGHGAVQRIVRIGREHHAWITWRAGLLGQIHRVDEPRNALVPEGAAKSRCVANRRIDNDVSLVSRVIGLVRQRRLDTDINSEFVEVRFLRNVTDGATDRARSIQRSLRSPQHFDAVEIHQFQREEHRRFADIG